MSFTLMDAIDQLIAEDALAALPTWEGAPLDFTSRYYSSTALDAAAARRAEINKLRTWRERIRHGWNTDPCGMRGTLARLQRTYADIAATTQARVPADYSGPTAHQTTVDSPDRGIA